jgi:serine/threonine protein kinase
VAGDEDTVGRDPVEELAESYLRELREGKLADVEQYTVRFPEHATRIREFFPLLAAIEGLKQPDLQQPPKSPGVPDAIGDYRPLREIGRGGMGVVYEALQPALGRHVALKLLPPLAAGDPENQRRLRDEAHALAQLEHPNIVPIYDVGEQDGQPYFSMQLVRGSNLAERLNSGPLPEREAAELLLPVCHAMAAAHRHGVIHRDLKPSNILLDAEGRPLVADFGLARFVSHEPTTLTGGVAGTPCYMSPEQAGGGGGLGAASDIYSLGAMLYEMLTGRPPFQAASPVETILMVLEEDVVPPCVINRKIDRNLEAIVLKCLAKEPAARYASAAELASDLQAYLEDRPVSARRFRLSDLWAITRRETRYVSVMHEAAVTWMFLAFYSAGVFLAFAVLKWYGVENHLIYYATWGASIPLLLIALRLLASRRGGESLIQRQVAFVGWTAGTVCFLTLVMEGTLRLPTLVLSPIFSVVSFGQNLVLANLTSGIFYLPAVGYFLCTPAMMVLVRLGRPDLAITLLAVTHFAAHFIPGLIFFFRGRRRSQ